MDLLNDISRRIAPQDAACRDAAVEHILHLAMPRWALGRLLDLAVDLAGITGDLSCPVARKRLLLLAGDHGIVRQGVCPQPSSVTCQMVRNFIAGGAGVNAIASTVKTEVSVADFGIAADLTDLTASGRLLDRKIACGTNDFSVGPAMSRAQAVRTVEAGIRLAFDFADSTDVFAVGEMGIGNSSPATAIVTVFAGASDPTPFVGRGAGLPEGRLGRKAAVIRRGIERNLPDAADALDVLSKIGGFEIGGIAGVILGAAVRRKPVVVDGFIASAGALIAARLVPAARDFMILAHGSAEPGHAKMAELLGKIPLLDLGMRLGEGSGAALAMPLLDAASAVMNRVATFEAAGVTTEGIRL